MTGLWIVFWILLVVAVGAGIFCGWLWERVWKGVVIFVVGLAITIGLTWWNWATTYRNDHWAECHVTGKDRGANSGSYRVYTSDCGQLSNEDSWLRGKHNSAELWQQIPEEGVVRLQIAGIRVRTLHLSIPQHLWRREDRPLKIDRRSHPVMQNAAPGSGAAFCMYCACFLR